MADPLGEVVFLTVSFGGLALLIWFPFAAMGLRRRLLRRMAPETVAVGMSGSQALLPIVLLAFMRLISPWFDELGGTATGTWLSPLGAWFAYSVLFLLVLGVPILVVVAVTNWFDWARSTRRGARRTTQEWRFAVWGLTAAIAAGPLLVFRWIALD